MAEWQNWKKCGRIGRIKPKVENCGRIRMQIGRIWVSRGPSGPRFLLWPYLVWQSILPFFSRSGRILAPRDLETLKLSTDDGQGCQTWDPCFQKVQIWDPNELLGSKIFNWDPGNKTGILENLAKSPLKKAFLANNYIFLQIIVMKPHV